MTSYTVILSHPRHNNRLNFDIFGTFRIHPLLFQIETIYPPSSNKPSDLNTEQLRLETSEVSSSRLTRVRTCFLLAVPLVDLSPAEVPSAEESPIALIADPQTRLDSH